MQRLEGKTPIKRSMDLEVVEMALVKLRAVTGCCGESVSGATLTVDGVSRGLSTNDAGECSLLLTSGKHTVVLEHSAFGEAGRFSHDLDVSRNQSNDHVLAAEVRIFIYATEPEKEEEEEGAAEDENDYGPVYDPSVVWVAADRSHIDDEAKPLQGSVRCEAAGSGRCSAQVVHLDPAKVVATLLQPQGEVGRCQLGRLRLSCHRPEFYWSPKDPTPLAERVDEIGGCELMRLMTCPVALGFLKPAATVLCADGTRLQLPLDEYGEVAALRSHIASELGADAGEVVFECKDGSSLSGPYIAASTTVFCAKAGEDIAKARALLQKEVGG